MLPIWKKYYILNQIKYNKSLFERIYNIHVYKNRPLSKIFGYKSFWKNDFKTNYHTLDPRPCTEKIIEIISNTYNLNTTYKILELGVGTGAVIISALNELINSIGVGIDISHKALRVARYNQKNILINKERLILKYNNWLNNINEKYDILIANPPYLRVNEMNETIQYDPKIALYEPEHLYFYKQIRDKLHLFKHIILEVNSLIDISEYTNLFVSVKKFIPHYLDEEKTKVIILEIYM